jgi:ferric-dicitrate binding protein FerR (iron transport regulator)
MSEKKQTWQDELDTLLARLVDEELSATDTKRLNEILSDNPAARDQYHAYMDVHEALQEQFSIPDFTALDKVVTPEPEPSYRRPILAMAALVMIGFFINFLVREPAQPPVAGKRAEVEPIAKVRSLSGSLIYTGDRGIVRKDLKEGDSLEGGTIEGMTPDAWFELEFFDGSIVMISGNSMLTFSDDGQKKLRLKEGGFSANVNPQPKDKPMLVSTRTALFEVMGTRFSVDTESTAATLRVSEGRVRATRLSDNLSVEVPAKHRVVASQDHELTPERLPDSISIWESRLERGAKGGNGDWVPAQGGEPAHLRAIPYTIDAKIDAQQRTIYTIGMSASRKDSPPVILKPGSRIRVQGKMDTPHAIWFGVTLRSADGDFAGHFQIIEPPERFQPGETFDVTLNPEEYHLDPSLKKWAAGLAKKPFGLKVGSVWCHSLWDSVGLQVSKMEILAPEESGE